MKALTVKQPWAHLICSGIKDIENRTWRTNFRGRVLIHAGANTAKFTDLLSVSRELYIHSGSLRDNHEAFKKYIHSAVIGSVEIVDCVVNHSSVWAEKNEVSKSWGGVEVIVGKPIYNWVLANPIMFPKPIPTKGKLSFWEYDMQCPQFSHFGASYPDAACIDGYLWDLDSDENGQLTQGGNDPCPYCNPDQYLGNL